MLPPASIILLFFVTAIFTKTSQELTTRKIYEEVHLIVSRVVMLLGASYVICAGTSVVPTDWCWSENVYRCLHNMYMLTYNDPIDAITTTVGDTFTTGNHTTILYTKAQVFDVDMLMSVHQAFWVAELLYLYLGGGQHIRRDNIIVFHHVLTITLIACARVVGVRDYFLIVTILHDVSDVFISMTKIFHLLEWESAKGWYVTEVSFVVMVIVWIYTRVILFGYLVLSLLTANLTTTNVMHAASSATVMSREMAIGFMTMLTVLLAVQIRWTQLILRMACKISTKGAHDAGEMYTDTQKIVAKNA